MSHSSQSELPERDLELLSAYIDNELAPADRTTLEQRLAADTRLRRELAELRATRDLLREQPWVTPPRSFTLTPDMVGSRQHRFGLPRWLQPLSGLAVLALAVLIGWQVLRINSNVPSSAQPQAIMAATAPPSLDSAALDAQTEAMTPPAAAAALNQGNTPSNGLSSTQTERATAVTALQQPSKDSNDGIAAGAGGDSEPPASAQRQPPPTTSPSPPPLPIVIGLAVLIMIAAGVWLVRRRAD